MEKQHKDIRIPSPDSLEIYKEHDDESLPKYDNVELAIVTPCYKELASGNVANALTALSGIEVPKDGVAQIFVINNPRLYWALSEISKSIDITNIDLLVDKLLEYIKNGLPFDEFKTLNDCHYVSKELHELKKATNYEKDDFIKTVKRFIEAYRENEATYKLLKVLEVSDDTQTLGQKEALLKTIWESYYPHKSLPGGFIVALRRGVKVAAINCFSHEKGFKSRNIGKAKNTGLHLALEYICPNAQYLHFADGDTHRKGSWVKNTLGFAKNHKADVVILQHETINRIPPERLQNLSNRDQFLYLMEFYGKSLVYRFAKYSKYTNHVGGSQILISRKAFDLYQYPDGDTNTDFQYASILKNDDELNVLYGSPGTEVVLSNRMRFESIDGASTVARETKGTDIAELRRKIDGSVLVTIKDALRIYKKMAPFLPSADKKTYLSLYRNIREQRMSEHKRSLRRIKRTFSKIFDLRQNFSTKEFINSSTLLSKSLGDQLIDNSINIEIILNYLQSIQVTNFEKAWILLTEAFPNILCESHSRDINPDAELNFIEKNSALPPNRTCSDYFPIIEANEQMRGYIENRKKIKVDKQSSDIWQKITQVFSPGKTPR